VFLKNAQLYEDALKIPQDVFAKILCLLHCMPPFLKLKFREMHVQSFSVYNDFSFLHYI